MLKKYKNTFCILLLIITIFVTSCSNSEPSAKQIDVFAMDTFMNVKAYTDDDELLGKVELEILRLEGLFSVTNDESDISRLNDNGFANVDNDTAELISKALEVGKSTNGSLDISIYPLVELWGFTNGNHKIPTTDEIAEKLELANIGLIKVDGNSVSLGDNMKIDLGAVAKGYTSDKICQMLRENGVEHAVINLGGNVQTISTRPDGQLWKVGIVNPFSTNENLLIVQVENKAVITSGNYERYFVGEDGKRYCHIIDGKTGCPCENGIVSMTVIGESGLKCDALSTALYVMGEEDAVEFWRNSDDFEMIYVTDSGKIGVTSGIYEFCINQSDYDIEVIERE